MRIGVLTGGGDCPGLNAVIRAVVRKGVAAYGHEFVGFRDGWKGPLEGLTKPLGIAEVRGILPRGGTILGSSRTNPFKIEGGVEKIKANLAEQVLDRAKAEELWNPLLKAWFPDGLDTPGLALLKVHATSAEYWESAHSSKVITLLGYAKAAVTGKTPDAGENETVRM